MKVLGFNLPDIPEDVLATYPYAVIFKRSGNDAPTEYLLYVSVDVHYYGSKDIMGIDAVSSLVEEQVCYKYNVDSSSWEPNSDNYPIVGTQDGITQNVVWANHDILAITAFDDWTGEFTTGYLYFAKSEYTFEERCSAPTEWFLNIASHARRVGDINTDIGIDDINSALSFATPGSWLSNYSWDNPNQILSSDAKVIALNPPFGLSYNVITLDFPYATRIDGAGFNGYESITTIYAPVVETLGMSAFNNCSGLQKIEFPSLTQIEFTSFINCTTLTKVDLAKVTHIEGSSFYGCTALEALIIRTTDVVCTLTGGLISGSNGLTDTGIEAGTGYIYVPSALVDSYKAADQWSTYAAQIRAIEDYPDICGTT